MQYYVVSRIASHSIPSHHNIIGMFMYVIPLHCLLPDPSHTGAGCQWRSEAASDQRRRQLNPSRGYWIMHRARTRFASAQPQKQRSRLKTVLDNQRAGREVRISEAVCIHTHEETQIQERTAYPERVYSSKFPKAAPNSQRR